MTSSFQIPEPVERATTEFVRSLVSEWIGGHPEEENFVDTPRRVRESFAELLQGHRRESLDEISRLLEISFRTKHDEMVVIRGIQGAGVCPHHFLPVLYTVHFAYIPCQLALGLSKVPRIIKLLCARASLQEDVTSTIADTFFESPGLTPKGVAVIVRGFHSCMSIRGTHERSATTITSAMRGCFLDNDDSSKVELLSLLKLDGGVSWD